MSRMSSAEEGVNSEVLRVEDLAKEFRLRKSALRTKGAVIRAVDGVDLTIMRGQTLGLVGESGCGKSTTGRLIARLLEPTAGRIVLQGIDVTQLSAREFRFLRARIQIMFQDPYSALSPRMTVHDIVAEPLRIQKRYRQGGRERVGELLEMVGLTRDSLNRYAQEFSGGQRQRIAMARALALGPELLILDEPTSALDMSVQAQIVGELLRLQRELALSYLFISHNLGVVRHIADRVAVMYLGKIVEIGTRDEIFEQARHPYTQALLAAVPKPDPGRRDQRQRVVLRGDVPTSVSEGIGCRFRSRCWRAEALCHEVEPTLMDGASGGHVAACHFPLAVSKEDDDAIKARPPQRPNS